MGYISELVEPKNIDVYYMDNYYDYGAYEVIPKALVHNVPNCGYLIHIGDKRLVYATDTNSMDDIKAKNYDLYMIEANYNEEEITERIRQKQEAGEYCHEWDVLRNHLSEEKALNWLYKNMGAKSMYIFMHQHEMRENNE